MTTQMSFPHAPITEALIDIRVELPNDVNIHTLAEYQNDIKKFFPLREVKVEMQASFEFKQGEAPQVKSVPVQESGYLFYTPEKNKLVQARLDGFTFNLLKPYTNWEDFSLEGQQLWQHYKKLVKPLKITRVALRYINKIEIPLPVKSLDEYLKTRPVVCPDITTSMDNFLLKINVSPTADNHNSAIILETIGNRQVNTKILPIILDIDVFRAIDIEPENEKQLWTILEELRSYKNLLFMNSVTEKTIKLFQ